MAAKTEGLLAAPPTPMTADGAVDPGGIERLYEMLRANGVRGAFVCGTTGEGLLLSVEERRLVAERWAQVAGEGFKVIVHVGHESVQEARALAAHARQVGAYAVAAISPSFFKPARLEELVEWCARVAEAAPDLPFYYYHLPAMSGVRFPVADFLEAAAPRIPNLAGAKFTYEDLLDYGRCLRMEGGRFDMLFGRDEILLSALVLGAHGAIGTTYNFAAPIYLRVMEAFGAGDLEAARATQAKAAEMVNIMNRHGGLAAVKPIMRMIGLDCGPVRLPLRTLTAQECDALRRELQAVGFFEFCCRA